VSLACYWLQLIREFQQFGDIFRGISANRDSGELIGITFAGGAFVVCCVGDGSNLLELGLGRLGFYTMMPGLKLATKPLKLCV
jgi:hypothetical protein